MLPPTAPGTLEPLKFQPDHNQSSVATCDQAPNPSPEFLLQDNRRLRNNSDHLRVELEMSRRWGREMQAQLHELREGLGPLEHLVQELLDVPTVQNGEHGIANRLFAICDMVKAMDKALSPVPGV